MVLAAAGGSHTGNIVGDVVGALIALGTLFIFVIRSVRSQNKPATWTPPQLPETRVRVLPPSDQLDRPSAGTRDRPSGGARDRAPAAPSGWNSGGEPGQSRGKRKNREPETLPADSRVTFAEERKAAGIDEVLEALDRDLVGLVPIKRKVEQIASLLLVDRARRRFGLTAPRPNLHMCFTGPPGTGKTTMALRMADLLHRLGYLETGQLVHAMRDDLVGEYIGQTAPKTRRVLERAMGGVLFIDEAYYLFRATDSKDYGQEAIEILLQVMENDRENLVVVLAGYKDRMDEFFSSNPGMGSRIAHHLDFAPYDVGELVSIGHLFLKEANYHLAPDAEAAFRQYVGGQVGQPGFAYARTVRNDLDRARLRQAHRLAADGHRPWTREDLMRLEAEDILDEPGEILLGSEVLRSAARWQPGPG